MSSSPMVVVDSREPELMAVILQQLGVEVEKRTISPGDYVLQEGYAVERKSISDFFNSIFTGRLFDQAERLRSTYTNPLLLVEGDLQAELSERRNPRAFWGALLTIQFRIGLPVLTTFDMAQSADAIYTLAHRALRGGDRQISVLHKPRTLTERELQISVVSSLPGIGPELAKRLLESMFTVRRVFSSSKLELMKIPGIGEQKATRITAILDRRIEEED